ncbi:MAG TPA: macro domain-containing protein [Candidatus Limnocylindria bacterium]|nr:macro domain-containing protein [Candidatus Limnocylindria bacterium]
MAEPIEIDVWQGEIAELEVDAIVVAASESLFMTAGAGASVKRAGGDEIERAAVDQGPIRPGTAVATGGGSLAAPYVIHAVAVGHDRRADAETLAGAIRAALAFAEPLQLRRIAMAPLGVEHGAFPAPDAAEIIVSTLLAEASTTPIDSIVLAAPHAGDVRALSDALQAAEAGAGSR